MSALLPWIILLAPLLSAIVIVLATHRSRHLSSLISVGAVLLSFLCSCIVFFVSAPTSPNQFLWLDFGREFQVPIGMTIDQLSKTMLLVVTGIGSLIHIYSLGYMREDEGKSRYFAALSLFMFSMLGIVLANNFVMMFIFWELVGVSSYLLIGHWFTRDSAAAAANKAFITNRIGDFGFMLGILMIWVATGSVVFSEIQGNMAGLSSKPAESYLTAAVLLIFCGAVGKSAQVPLHVWLPDAMEGPTPVSALIHAATMVAAGVYMLARVFFLVSASLSAQHVIAWVGIITAVLAALMATQQNDIKRILAYSTLSQLGYMICAIGLASPHAAMFHLFTHAFFKALLFLGAGSVILAAHHEQDIWKMGGLKERMPVTFATFALGTLALTGCPPLSGFFSKDAILLAAWGREPIIFGLALLTAFLTAFYMFRLFTVVFLGSSRSEAAGHSHENPRVITMPLMILAVPTVIAGWPFIINRFVAAEHGAVHSAVVPVLAIVAFVAGAAGAFLLYRGREKDPVLIPMFANRFYIDELYALLIHWTHDLWARVSAWFDRWVLDGAVLRGFSGGTWGIGYVLRFLQFGNLQGYSFLLGLGVVGLIYFVLFK